MVVPAAILGVDKGVDFGGEGGEGLVRTKSVVALLAVAVFNALHEAGLADFHILVEIGAGNGEKLDPFEERIGGVFSFFENAAIELHPRVVASGKELLFLLRSSHLREYKPCWQVYSFCWQNWNPGEGFPEDHAYRSGRCGRLKACEKEGMAGQKVAANGLTRDWRRVEDRGLSIPHFFSQLRRLSR